jgi:hypothetical protein
MQKPALWIAVILVLAVLAVALTIWLVAPRATIEVKTDRTGETEALAAAKAAVATRAPDAQSINFGDLKVNWVGDNPAVCGQVDIVEEQDSFTGMERFVWVDGQVTLEESDGSDAVTRQWQAVCQSV